MASVRGRRPEADRSTPSPTVHRLAVTAREPTTLADRIATAWSRASRERRYGSSRLTRTSRTLPPTSRVTSQLAQFGMQRLPFRKQSPLLSIDDRLVAVTA